MNAVFDYALWFAQACTAIAMMGAAVRLFIGPAAQDRTLAFDSLYMNGMLMLLILGMRSRSSAYFDMALLVGLFGFVGTVALAKFLLRGEVIEP
ncbi:MAG TPA: K+/H+ antiporter subunit F [Steroidobacteraceae bacterium]|jgi:multicomponent K+:H+ antiporter subunit F